MHSQSSTRRLILLFTVTVAVCTLAALAPAINTNSLSAYAGTWEAQFQGKTFFTVTLTEENAKLTGTVSHSRISLDKDGGLIDAQALEGADPIAEAALTGQTLHLTSKDQGSQDTTQYEMELSGSAEAMLRFAGLPADQPAPQPWKLTRVAAKGTAVAPTAAAATGDAAANMKQKLATAAQIWLSGQFGNPSSANTSASPAVASASPAVANASPAPVSTGPAASSAVTAKATEALTVGTTPLDPPFAKDVDGLPRRVNDEFKNAGDMVNFVIVGSEEQVQSALSAGKWFVADSDNTEAALKAILQTYQKKDYMQMPMSKLMLFGRFQDYGYEQAEPIAMVASRHHFRLWKAPFTCNGQPVWVGAGTHDIGFERDQRNGKITHKIDPAVDGERENIAETLHKSGKVKSMTYYLPPDPVQEARNATGGGYHSDGRMLVVVLQ